MFSCISHVSAILVQLGGRIGVPEASSRVFGTGVAAFGRLVLVPQHCRRSTLDTQLTALTRHLRSRVDPPNRNSIPTQRTKVVNASSIRKHAAKYSRPMLRPIRTESEQSRSSPGHGIAGSEAGRQAQSLQCPTGMPGNQT